MAESKKKPEQCDHEYVITEWRVAGGIKQAVKMRCRKCLKELDLDAIKFAEKTS